MLGETRKKLLAREFDDQWCLNALIESFCIHARNLNEFLLEQGKHRDLLKASDFAAATYKKPRSTKARRAPFSKIDQQIAYLTKKRTAVARHKIGDQQREAMFARLYADLKNFDSQLKPRLRRKWKVSFSAH
jgi:hypothetical protein